jgi:hypothetical protein
MEAMGEKNALAKHALVTCGKFDLGDGESVAKMESAIHIRIWKVAKPFRIFLCDLCGREAIEVRNGWSVDLEEMF